MIKNLSQLKNLNKLGPCQLFTVRYDFFQFKVERIKNYV